MAELIWTRRYAFQSVHALKQAREKRHGHEYFLEVSFRGREIDDVDQVIRSVVLDKMHARELKQFAHASGEFLVDGIHEMLMETPLKNRVCAVALQETRKNRFVSRYSEARFV